MSNFAPNLQSVPGPSNLLGFRCQNGLLGLRVPHFGPHMEFQGLVACPEFRCLTWKPCEVGVCCPWTPRVLLWLHAAPDIASPKTLLDLEDLKVQGFGTLEPHVGGTSEVEGRLLWSITGVEASLSTHFVNRDTVKACSDHLTSNRWVSLARRAIMTILK